MDDWENCNETLLPEKDDYYSYLNMEKVAYLHELHETPMDEQSDMLIYGPVFH